MHIFQIMHIVLILYILLDYKWSKRNFSFLRKGQGAGKKQAYGEAKEAELGNQLQVVAKRFEKRLQASKMRQLETITHQVTQ